MERIVNLLEGQGMNFAVKNDTKNNASLYIKYNTSWNMLKQSRNLLYINSSHEKKYKGLSFYDIRTSGLVHYYFNNTLENIVKEFEHCLKVYMSDKYEHAKYEEKLKILSQITMTNFNYNYKKIILNENNFFELYSFATLSELLTVYKIIKSKIKNEKLRIIDSKIANIRNTISHHNNILIENKPDRNPNVDTERISELRSLGLQNNQIEYLKINYQYNTLRLIIDMIEHVNYFLSIDECTLKRKNNLFSKALDNIGKSEHYYNKLSRKDWIDIYFSSINILITKLNQ